MEKSDRKVKDMEKKSFIPEVYDPVEYWNSRDQPNTDANPGISPAHRAVFDRHLKHGARVLELGPGIGRLFPVYEGCSELATLDLTHQHEATLKTVASQYDLPLRQEFLNDALAPFPFADQSFDLAVSAYVFIHVPFENIRHSMSEMARVAQRAIVFATSNPNWPKTEAERKPSSHCFDHDYDALCRELGMKIVDRVEFPNPKLNRTGLAFAYEKA